MLQSIRDRVTGYVALGVILLITIPFSLWGIESYFTSSDNPDVAEVGGVKITKNELDQAYDQQLQQLRRLMGENFREDLLEPETFRRDVLEKMIQERALAVYIEKQDLAVDDASVSDYVRDLPVFQVDGQFSQETYLSLLARQGLSPTRFEDDVRGSLAMEQLRGAVLESAFLSDAVVANTYRLLQQKRALDYLRIDADKLKESVELSDDEVAARYDKDKAQYALPERVQIQYAILDKTAYEPEPAPEEAMLRDMYETEKTARFSKPEQREARHILLRVDDDTSDEQAKERLQNLSSQIEGGADFSELAESTSEDPGSKEKGGKLDPVTKGMLDPAFEDALFSMAEGEISAPVRTDFGWHLIKLDKVLTADVLPFDDAEVQRELNDLYQSKMLDERFRQEVAQMGELAYENDNSLQPVLDALGLQLETTAWITRDSGEGIASNDAVRDAAFSEEVLLEGYNSQVLDLDSQRKLVLRVAKHEEARTRPLEEVRAQIVDNLKSETAAKQALSAAAESLKAANAGQSLSELADQPAASYKQAGPIGRDSEVLEPAAVALLFSMPRPEAGATQYASLVLSDGDAAVLALKEVVDASLADADEAEKENTRRNLRGRIAGAEFQAFIAALREDLGVEIYDDKL